MPTPQENLKNLLERFSSNNPIGDSVIVHIMVLTREILELRNIKSRYSLLNLYCTWCLHPKISESRIRNRIFKQLTDILVDALAYDENEKEGLHNIRKRTSEVIALSKLRQEFIKLYKSLYLPLFLFERDENWRNLVSVIFSILLDKPIELNPEGKRINEEVLDYMREKTELLTISEPFKFSIVQIQNPKSKKLEVCWQIDVMKKEVGIIHFAAPFYFTTE